MIQKNATSSNQLTRRWAALSGSLATPAGFHRVAEPSIRWGRTGAGRPPRVNVPLGKGAERRAPWMPLAELRPSTSPSKSLSSSSSSIKFSMFSSLSVEPSAEMLSSKWSMSDMAVRSWVPGRGSARVVWPCGRDRACSTSRNLWCK